MRIPTSLVSSGGRPRARAAPESRASRVSPAVRIQAGLLLVGLVLGGCGKPPGGDTAAEGTGPRDRAAAARGADRPGGRHDAPPPHPEGLGDDLPAGPSAPPPPNRVTAVALPDPAPNVLLIVVDTLRADHLSCYGSLRAKTPNLDRLAAEGVRFDWTFSTTPNTVLSMAAMMTSRWPAENGVQWQLQKLEARNLTLAEILATAGYRTSAVIGNGVLRPAQGFGQGFESYALHNFPVGKPLTDLALEDLDRLAHTGTKPWFQWVHYLDPHWPYDPPEAWAERYSRDPALLPRAIAYVRSVGSRDPERHVSLEQAFFRNTLPDAIHQEVRGLYEAEVTYVDHEIGRLLDGLAARGLAENTIVIVTADHGESLGEHGLFYTHDPYVYDPDLHIPLLWRAPASLGLKPGHHVPSIVRQIDILPTITEMLGIRTARPFSGRSLLPLLRGEEEREPRLAFSQSVPLGLQPEVKDEYLERPRIWRRGVEGAHRTIRVQDWRLVAVPEPGGTAWELYNEHIDPRERWNLIAARTLPRHIEHPRERAVEQELRRRLMEWVRTTRGRGGAVPELSEEERRRLESLGYISAPAETKRHVDPEDEDGATGPDPGGGED